MSLCKNQEWNCAAGNLQQITGVVVVVVVVVHRLNIPLNTLQVILGTIFTGQMTKPTVSEHWRKPVGRQRSGLSPSRTTPPCYNNTTLGNCLYAQCKCPNVTKPICLTCKNCSCKNCCWLWTLCHTNQQRAVHWGVHSGLRKPGRVMLEQIKAGWGCLDACSCQLGFPLSKSVLVNTFTSSDQWFVVVRSHRGLGGCVCGVADQRDPYQLLHQCHSYPCTSLYEWVSECVGFNVPLDTCTA